MDNRDNNSRNKNRERVSDAKYSTINHNLQAQRLHEDYMIRRQRIIVFTVLMVVLLSLLSIFIFFSWDDIISLSNDIDEQIINTPTPLPTKIPAPTIHATASPTPEPIVTPAPVVTATPKPPVIEFTISVVGDLSFYQSQLNDAYDQTDGTYDFSHNFEAVKPYLENSNFVIGNFNTVCLGADQGYNGDPNNLNTPEVVLDAIHDAGIDALMTANENFFSQGWLGVQYTNNFIRKAGLISTGSYLSEVEYYKPLMVEVEGIKIALLNYADKRAVQEIEQNITDKQSGYGIKVLKMSNVNRDVDICKSAGADLIFAYVNWGTKTALAPTSDIASYATTMTEAGIDCIFGAYPEVVQPIVPRGVKRKINQPSTGIIAYSLGSFISSRRTEYLDSAAILNVTYKYDTINNTLNMGDITYVPTWISVDNVGGDNYNFRIIPVGEYLDTPSLYSTLSEAGQERLPNVWNEIVGVLGDGLVAPIRSPE